MKLTAGALLLAAAFGVFTQGPNQAPPNPVADHHVHLRSPAMTQLLGEHIPPIALPADLQLVLEAFESHWRARNAGALASLFTPDGVMQVGRDWQRGPAGIHLTLLGRGGNVRFHPQSFGSDTGLGYIAGSYAGNTEAPPGDRGRFMLALRRSGGGPWRIADATFIDLPAETRVPATTVDELVAQLDAAGIRQGALLSWAYQFGAVNRQPADERAKVRAENVWTAEQAARFPDRLVSFCSLNPLKDYALEELGLCMADARNTGFKLHFTTAGVDLRDSRHVAQLLALFRAANARRFPVVIHMRTLDPEYGRLDAEVMLEELLPAMPDTVVHIAHLAGWGGYGAETDAALGVFADAAAAGDPRVANLLLDVAAVVAGASGETKATVARRIRQMGVTRILFAIDGPVSKEPWDLFRTLPLNEAEIRTIAGNLAPYMRLKGP
jgi:predicted TIM-barrel fold metal-dependent hydrolase